VNLVENLLSLAGISRGLLLQHQVV
jgi:hypothetical protein